MPSQPVVSIVMAAHNAARHLAETMDGIFAQTSDSWELIAIDDGSTDDTGDILDRYAKEDTRIRVIRQGNRGLAASLNSGVAEARGLYIARLDADDVPMPHRLATQVAWLDRHPEVVMVGSSAIYLAEGIRTNTLKSVPTDPRTIRRLLVHGNCMIHPTVVMRKSALMAAGGYRTCFRAAQDYDLWLRMVEQGPIANIAEPLIYYRIHSEQATVRKLHQQVWGVIAAQHAARQRRAGRPDPLDGVAEITEATIRSHLLLSQRPQALSYADSIQASADAIQWRTLFRPRLEWQLAVDAIRHRQPLAAVRHTIAALRSQPQLLLRLPARLLAGIRTIGGGKP
jgi:hypothetical protein